MMIASFLFFLVVFTCIGVSSYFFSKNSNKDYYLASHSMPSWLVGLSAVATNSSGYMFIGLIGYTYATGLASVWMMIGWISGDLIASLYVHKRLHRASLNSEQSSYVGVISHWGGSGFIRLQKLLALVSLFFLLAYAAAQLVSGGKALQVLFDWPHWAGAVLSASLVILYCFAGGIRASIWTDASQSFVMFFAMGLLFVYALSNIGGVGEAYEQMSAIEGFVDWFPKELALPGYLGAFVFVFSWMCAGFSVIGQPHIMVRFMTLAPNQNFVAARLWYYLWFSIFWAMATGVGLLSRILIADSGSFDAELALPTLALELFPPVLVGLLLAGIFAASMSTADSLILSCSAAVTHDLFPKLSERRMLVKGVTILVALLALVWALVNKQSVFNMVIMAWSGLASAFSPLLLVLVFGGRPSQKTALSMALFGFLVALVWRELGLGGILYEGMPGILAGLAYWLVVRYVLKTEGANPSARPVEERGG